MNPAPPVTHTIRELMHKPLSRRAIARLKPLGRAFYQRSTTDVARALLGKVLVRELPEGLVAVRLFEVEAYLGIGDAAAHTFGGRRTPRNEVMWGEGGHLYVYFIYGMHHCANVVTRRADEPEAVLLRGAVPLCGHEILAARRRGRAGRNMLDGPAKLCQALGLERTDNGADLTRASDVWLADDGFRAALGWLREGPRIGVGYAGEAAARPLRFVVDLALPADRSGGEPCARASGGAATRPRRTDRAAGAR